MRKNVQIVLTVDAEKLYHMKNYNQDDIDSYCSLTDDNGGKADNGKVQDFLSNVYLSKSVEWVGASMNKDYAVAVDRIVYDFDLNDPTDIYFLEDDEKIYGTGGENSKVVATVKDQQEIADTQNIYKINFSIYYKKERKEFLVDPKLKANT
jgi:hypothetical protein